MPPKGFSSKNIWRMKIEVDGNQNLEVRISTLAKAEIDKGTYDVDELFIECSQSPGWFRIVGSERVMLINDFLNKTYIVPFRSLRNLADSKDQNSMIFPGHETTEDERRGVRQNNESD